MKAGQVECGVKSANVDNLSLGTRRGYLDVDFKLFYLKDRKKLKFEPHFHDFDKLTFFISGDVTYLIEGRAYRLQPWDILFIRRSEVHKPIIDYCETYERIVIWVNPGFLEKHSDSHNDLESCFLLSAKNGRNLLRTSGEMLKEIRHTLDRLQNASNESNAGSSFGYKILENSIFMQLMVSLNRAYLINSGQNENSGVVQISNPIISDIITYINGHLSEQLTIDSIAEKFFLSRYHLMHCFKQSTGYSLHNYIMQKRLMLAGELMRSGLRATEASLRCGFQDYSNFMRAFKSAYNQTPKEYAVSGAREAEG